MEDPEFLKNLGNQNQAKSALPPAPPSHRERPKPDNEFRKALFRSFVFHAFLIVSALLFDVLAKHWGWQDQSLQERAFQELRSAIRVDVVDLPRLTQKELGELDLTKEIVEDPAPAEEKKEESIPSPPEPSKEAVEKPKEKDPLKGEKSVADKLKELKDRLSADQKRKEEIAKLLKKKGKGSDGRPELAGNIKSDGYSTTGDVATQAEAYIGKARAHVLKYWSVPGWIKVSDYSARIAIKISPSGKVIFKKMIQPSTSAEFDKLVNRAVEASDPFPSPPDALRLQMLQEGLELRFPK